MAGSLALQSCPSLLVSAEETQHHAGSCWGQGPCLFRAGQGIFFQAFSRHDNTILCIIQVSVLSGAAEGNCEDRKLGKTPSEALLMARCLVVLAQHFPFPPENKAAVIASTHKMQGILSAEISGNFTRTQITLVCRVQHCLEREQQTFPLEASFLFRAVYS